MSNKEEILRYIFSCVSYKHMFDLSPRITDSAQKKEDLLFSSAVFFLKELSKNKNVFVEDIKKGVNYERSTYEDWQKNPTPNKVIAIDNDDSDYEVYRHCAEIGKQRRMTNKELSRWLREKPTRESKYTIDNYVYSVHPYNENCGGEEVREDIVIREDDGEWREPLVEVEE